MYWASMPSGGETRPLLWVPGTTRVAPFAGEKSSSIQTVFIITGESILSISPGMSLWNPWSPSPGRTILELRLPRIKPDPRKFSSRGKILGWSMVLKNTGSSVGRLLTWRAEPRWACSVPTSCSQRTKALRMASTSSLASTPSTTVKP